jgi:hypothetical protein
MYSSSSSGGARAGDGDNTVCGAPLAGDGNTPELC